MTVSIPHTNQHISMNSILKNTIYPFQYPNKRPRLPRRRSNGYELQKDTERYFKNLCSSMPTKAQKSVGRFAVLLTVFKGADGLGGADLDNYLKSILDAVTNAGCFWDDDGQVDYLTISRTASDQAASYIVLEVFEIV